MTYESFRYEDTLEFARKLAEKAKPGDIYALDGDLGAGKTVFAKGFAKGLGIEDVIVSPTFTIMYVYDEGRIPMYHFDLYRLGDPEELYSIGFDEYVYGKGVSLIEWASLFRDEIKGACWIDIRRNPEKGDDYRLITVVDDREEK